LLSRVARSNKYQSIHIWMRTIIGVRVCVCRCLCVLQMHLSVLTCRSQCACVFVCVDVRCMSRFSTWHNRAADSASAAATPPVADAAVSSTALSGAASPSTGAAAVSANAATALSGVNTAAPHQALSCTSQRQHTFLQPFALRALQQVLIKPQQIQPPPPQMSALQTLPQALPLFKDERVPNAITILFVQE